MQYVPSLIPATALSQSPTPLPSEALSLHKIFNLDKVQFFFISLYFKVCHLGFFYYYYCIMLVTIQYIPGF